MRTWARVPTRTKTIAKPIQTSVKRTEAARSSQVAHLLFKSSALLSVVMKTKAFKKLQKGGFGFLDGFVFAGHLEKPCAAALLVGGGGKTLGVFIINQELRADHTDEEHRPAARRDRLAVLGEFSI